MSKLDELYKDLPKITSFTSLQTEMMIPKKSMENFRKWYLPETSNEIAAVCAVVADTYGFNPIDVWECPRLDIGVVVDFEPMILERAWELIEENDPDENVLFWGDSTYYKE